MRVISGKCRRLILSTIKGDNTRPTTDRIKETLFNIINDDVYESDFLDLFAGSGQIGIEALSRYANSAVFVDNSRDAVACINANLAKCHLEDDAKVMCDNYMSALKRFPDNSFDIIFMDPPYGRLIEKEILEYLSTSSVIRKGGLVIVEADLDTDFGYVDNLNYEDVRDKRYKTNRHLFLRKC